MGKVRGKQPLRHSNHHDNPGRTKKIIARRQHSQNGSSNKTTKSNPKSKSKQKVHASTVSGKLYGKPNVPFSEWDHILLIGEGDFSFALSLSRHHSVANIVATCFDSKEMLEEKYPKVKSTIAVLKQHNDQTVTDDSMESELDVWNGFSPTHSEDDFENLQVVRQLPRRAEHHGTVVLFNIDATKLSTTHRKVLRTHGPFTKIVFNFPHVGGLSTDVNRQVRSNQQLLVDFFKSAKPLLATPANPSKSIMVTSEDGGKDENDSMYDSDDRDLTSQKEAHLEHGKILVTIFEGEPYTLWNVRDLARHSGLKVLESFKFPWSAYPGYQHARTIGDITTGKDRTDDGKRKGAWRGEEREARCYVLALHSDSDGRPAPGSRKRRAREDDSE